MITRVRFPSPAPFSINDLHRCAGKVQENLSMLKIILRSATSLTRPERWTSVIRFQRVRFRPRLHSQLHVQQRLRQKWAKVGSETVSKIVRMKEFPNNSPLSQNRLFAGDIGTGEIVLVHKNESTISDVVSVRRLLFICSRNRNNERAFGRATRIKLSELSRPKTKAMFSQA